MPKGQDDLSSLTIWASKPKGKLAAMLADLGMMILPIEEDEDFHLGPAQGNIDRYILSERLAIERRTGSSFLRGIQDKTLFTSAIYLREHFEIPILIVEGQVDHTYTGFSPQAVRGALSSMMLLYGVNVLSTPDVEESGALIAMMARQEQTGIPEISLIPKRKAADMADMQRRVIEMLPGCAMTTARDLLQTFGSVRRIVNATPAELRSVRGIGAKRAAEIHQVLNAEYEAIDTERNLEDAIEAAPELLFFEQPVTLLARQHHVYTEGGERHVVDLVFLDDEANELILVELKRGKLNREHENQIRRYLEHAHQSSLLRPLLEQGTCIRGMLATVLECDLRPRSEDVAVRIVDKGRTIQVLKGLRDRRLKAMEAASTSGRPSRQGAHREDAV